MALLIVPIRRSIICATAVDCAAAETANAPTGAAHTAGAKETRVTPRAEFWRYVFCPAAVGTLVLVVALVVLWRRLGRRPETWPVLGRVFVPASLAAFGAEHLVAAHGLSQMVPTWMPAHLLVAYFVGIALLAAAASIVSTRLIRVAAPLLGTMFFIFVLSLHIPLIVAHPTDRFAWAVALRDLVFGLGAWTLAATSAPESQRMWSHRVFAGCRTVAALVFVFFGVEHVLHPGFVPGVPLERVIGPWVPAAVLWGYGVGVILIASGALMLINVRARAAATWLAVALTVTVPVIYIPMLFVAVGTSQGVEAVNYIFDSLLFAGSVLLLAAGMPSGSNQSAPARPVGALKLRRRAGAGLGT
jgi:uncharacterized membrane protein